MNEELQMLMALMNGEGNAAQMLSRGPGDGNNQGNQVTPLDDQATLNPNFGEPQEIEITEEMKAQNPVVNKARSRNQISGVSDFLANPEVQNALLQFGRAFSEAGNMTGVPGVGAQLADAGEGVIRENANQRALEAFERGEDPAQAAGRFADPELVTRLQDRRQQQEQFEQEMDLRGRELNIRETQLRNDSIFQAAQLGLDKDLAEARINNLEKQTEIDQQIADARQAWWEAQAEALGQEGQSENFALRTNEFIEVLGSQRNLLDEEVQQARDLLADMDVRLSDAEIQQLQSGELDASELDLSDADISNWPWPFPQDSEKARAQAQSLVQQLDDALTARESLDAQMESLRNVQTARLTGDTTAQQRQQQQEEGGGAQPQGTPDSPVQVNSMRELETMPVGSVVNFLGTVGRLTASGNIRPINNEEENE